jgi:hypothetical protein
MKVSFDFDHSLTNPKNKELAKKFLVLGAEVHITTSRTNDPINGKQPYDNREVFSMAERLGIKKENITFTSYADKYSFLKDFDLHFDDDEHEIILINEHPCKCIGVLITE